MIKWRAFHRLGYREFLDEQEARSYSTRVEMVERRFLVFLRDREGRVTQKLEFLDFDAAAADRRGRRKGEMKTIDSVII